MLCNHGSPEDAGVDAFNRKVTTLQALDEIIKDFQSLFVLLCHRKSETQLSEIYYLNH